MELAQETFANKDSLTTDEKLDKILQFNVLMSQQFKATENKLVRKMETFEKKIDAKLSDLDEKITVKAATPKQSWKQHPRNHQPS